MKFAILTDIHLGPEGVYNGTLRKVNKDAKKLLNEFIEEMNNNVKPEFVVILGDLIEDDDKATDIENINYIVKSLTKLNCPAHYAAGNHDLKKLSVEELANIFNQDKLYYSFDSNNLHFVVLFSKTFKDRASSIEDEQKAWFQKDLDKTNKKCVVFVHHALSDQDLTGNPWFEGRPEHCLVGNRKEIRSIISASNKVIAVFNSHLHWDKKDVHDGIPHFTIQSLVENEDDKGIASEAHAVINIIDDKIDVEIKGNYSKKL
jgi:3',5'-cyclic AMP phosphodiesterase CpdA